MPGKLVVAAEIGRANKFKKSIAAEDQSASSMSDAPGAGRVNPSPMEEAGVFNIDGPGNISFVAEGDCPCPAASPPAEINSPQQRNSSGNLTKWSPIESPAWADIPKPAPSDARSDDLQKFLIGTGYYLGNVVVKDMSANLAQKVAY